MWASVARHVRGETARDRAILRRAILRSPMSSLGKWRDWLNPHVSEDCRVRTSLGRFRVRADSDDLYLTLPTREPAVLAIIKSLKPGDFFVDAGANIGVYTVLASRLVGPSGRVVAIEMMPDTAQVLRRHVADNHCTNVEVIEAALSNAPDQMVEAFIEPGKSGQASFVIPQNGRAIRVRTRTFGDIFDAQPDLMKIDVEGAEDLAFKGMKLLPKRIVFEHSRIGDDSRAILRDLGYEVTAIDGANYHATLTINADPLR